MAFKCYSVLKALRSFDSPLTFVLYKTNTHTHTFPQHTPQQTIWTPEGKCFWKAREKMGRHPLSFTSITLRSAGGRKTLVKKKEKRKGRKRGCHYKCHLPIFHLVGSFFSLSCTVRYKLELWLGSLFFSRFFRFVKLWFAYWLLEWSIREHTTLIRSIITSADVIRHLRG